MAWSSESRSKKKTLTAKAGRICDKPRLYFPHWLTPLVRPLAFSFSPRLVRVKFCPSIAVFRVLPWQLCSMNYSGVAWSKSTLTVPHGGVHSEWFTSNTTLHMEHPRDALKLQVNVKIQHIYHSNAWLVDSPPLKKTNGKKRIRYSTSTST